MNGMDDVDWGTSIKRVSGAFDPSWHRMKAKGIRMARMNKAMQLLHFKIIDFFLIKSPFLEESMMETYIKTDKTASIMEL